MGEPDDEHGVVISTTDDDGARLVLSGSLDDVAVDRLRAVLDDVPGPRAVVRIDLSRAAHLPIGALRALAVTHRRLHGGEGRVVVVDPSPAALVSLRTSGLHRALRVGQRSAAATATVDEAVS